MNLFWISLGILGVILFGAALADYFNDFKAITIIVNCLIPIFALIIVCFLNEVQRIYKMFDESSDDDC